MNFIILFANIRMILVHLYLKKYFKPSSHDVSTALVEAKITDSDKGYDSAKQLKIIKNKPINRSQSVYTYKSGEIPLLVLV